MMVATVSETTTTRRPPLLPSEKDNGIIALDKSNRPKSRQVSSRYLSPSPSSSSNSNSNSNSSSLRTLTPSRRSSSPLISRNSTTPAAKRSVSADRRRPTRPDLTLKPNNAGGGAGEVSAATKLLVTSTRSLSVSFQGESFSLPISKTKTTPQSPNLSSVRKRSATPLRGDHVENTKPMDHHRWPGRIRQANNVIRVENNSKIIGPTNAIRALHQSINLDTRSVSINGGRLSLDIGSVDLSTQCQENPDGNLLKDSSMVPFDHTGSDTDSVSSSSTSGVQENGGSTRLRNGSAKFWQETNSRMRRLIDPGSPLSISPKSKLITPQKLSNSKKLMTDNSLLSSPRTMASSPNRMRPSSPSKFIASSSPSRGMISPRRSSVSGINIYFCETPSVLSFAVDVRRGKVGENRIFDAHLLRLLYNRQLQWRFVNARSEDMLLKQKHGVEENLWNAWITISDLRDSVTKKRHRLQLLRQKLMLASILKAQIVFLEDWAYLDKNHSISLLGAIESLKASTLRLPVGAGAIADQNSMKDAINSALDVMQAMGSSIHALSLQVEEMNLMVTELANVLAKERDFLRICKDFLAILATLKVKDCSLRTHMLQMNRA